METKPDHIASFPLAMLSVGGLGILCSVLLSLCFAMEHPLAVALVILAMAAVLAAAVSLLTRSVGRHRQGKMQNEL